MGLWWSRLVSLFGDQEARILVLGLDNAGKTTILCTSLTVPIKPLCFLEAIVTAAALKVMQVTNRLRLGDLQIGCKLAK